MTFARRSGRYASLAHGPAGYLLRRRSRHDPSVLAGATVAFAVGPAVVAAWSGRPGRCDDGPVSGSDGDTAAAPPRLVFRHSALGILAALLFLVCALPLMLSLPWFWLIVLLPLGFCVWLLRTRTTVDSDSVTARTLRGARQVTWDDVTSLRLDERSRVSAVLTDDTELALPAVRLRDLPAVAVASGGRIADPSVD